MTTDRLAGEDPAARTSGDAPEPGRQDAAGAADSGSAPGGPSGRPEAPGPQETERSPGAEEPPGGADAPPGGAEAPSSHSRPEDGERRMPDEGPGAS
ncbi:hypothetical protein [Streptomyces sp. 8N706]|uniref:hypothetical protein n=1 Tax=Streptomyces sp. 8N706 TaxID=3457416 RepID=UPI003FD1D0A3